MSLVLTVLAPGFTNTSSSQVTPSNTILIAESNLCTGKASQAVTRTLSEVQFQTGFETKLEFYDRFVYFVGNHCSQYSANTCRIENLPEFLSPINSWLGDHNLACGAPTTSREVNVKHHAEYFWWCA